METLPVIKTEYLDAEYTPDYVTATTTTELQPGMYVNHVASPGVTAAVVAVNRGFALVEMMDGSGTRQCAVSDLSPVPAAAPAAGPTPMSLHSNLNSINADPPSPYYHEHDDLTLGVGAMAFPGTFPGAFPTGMELFAPTTDPMQHLDEQLFSMDQSLDMDMSLGFDLVNSAVPSFFDEQYA
jgi:hypothetical protein